MRTPSFAPFGLKAIHDTKLQGFEHRKVSRKQARNETLTKSEFSQATARVRARESRRRVSGRV